MTTAGGRRSARAGCWPPAAWSTSCPTCPGWPSAGATTCCTAPTATAGRCATRRSPSWPAARWPATRACSSASSPTTSWSSSTTASSIPDEEQEKLGAIGVRFAHGTPHRGRHRRRRARRAAPGRRVGARARRDRGGVEAARARRLPRRRSASSRSRSRWTASRSARCSPVEPTGATVGAGDLRRRQRHRHLDDPDRLRGPRQPGRRLDQRRARLRGRRAPRSRSVATASSSGRRGRSATPATRSGAGGSTSSSRPRPPTLAPGRALDVGCGEGGDALWLAQQGWQVTAVDFADAALARVAEHAADAGVGDRIETRPRRRPHLRARRRDLGPRHLALLPPARRRHADVVRRLASAVAPGGTLLVVGHHPEDLATGLRHGHDHLHVHRRRAAARAAARTSSSRPARRARAPRRTRTRARRSRSPTRC